MDHNDDTTTIEDFANRPLKKAKYPESSVLVDPLQSPSISASSMVSECSESTGSESSDPLQSPPSPTMSTLSPVSELMNQEIISEEDDKQTASIDYDKQPDEVTHMTNDVTYDYLPEGRILLLFLLMYLTLSL